MNTKKTKKSLWTVLFSFLLILTIIVMGGGIIGSLNERETLSSDKIAAQAASVNYEEFADDNFSRFKDGIKYIYTEATKARNYHDAFIKGNTPTADDVEEVTVDVVNANRGTKQNPYVITNITEWNALATMAGTNYANTTGKFFALGCDIDAGSVSNVLKQIPAFGGVFCGNGYMISNIKIDSSTTGYPTTTNNGRGLFNSISGATISDLRIKISVAAPSAATYNGGLVGFIGGHSNILNCQADTTWNQSSAGDYFGGLVGRVDAGLTVLLYRCSSTFNFTISGRPTFYGGLIGATTGAVNLSIFDSSSRTVSDLGNNTDNRYSGGIVGAFETSNNANFYLENIISDIDAKSGKVVWDAAVVHVQAASNWPKKLVLKNVWASGTDTVGSTKTSRYTVTCGDTNNHKANVRGAADFTNVKSTQVYARQILASYAGVDDYSNTSAKYYVQSIGGTDQADAETKLWNGAKTDGNLPADIWGDKSTIGSGFGLTASIINPMKVTVSYYSYKVDASGTDISTPYSVTNQNYLFVSRGAPLYTPTATNRVFKGWTADPTDGSAPFKEMPSNLRGTVKLYAVWELNEASVSITGTGSSITGSATDGYELVYNGNGSGKGITLTANFSAEGIGNPDTDATITYEWYSIDKNNAYQANGGAEKTQKVENVGDSGTYSVTVKYQSKNEPLFTGEVKAENVTPVTATIKPALLTYIKVTFPDENKRPYSGADYETAVPTAEFRNSSNQVIEGTTEWVSTLHCFNDKYANVTDGVETKEIKFTPASIYNGNYGTEIKKFVEFEIEFLKLTFNIPKLSITLEVELEYGQPYTYANVATEFDKVFKPYLEDAEGYTPAFENQNGEYIKLNEYRNQTGTAYSDVITNYTINVSLVPQTYTATFDARNNGNSAAIPSQTRGHGKRLEKPADPTYGMQLFLGWYYLDSDDGGKEKKWDFNEDRLTKDLELYAKWLSADTLLPDLEVENNKNTYFALEEIDVSMLKVTAVFEGHDEGGETITQRVELTSDQYVLEYEGGKSQFHVKADGSKAVVTIKYTFINSEGEEQEGTYDLKITVNPIVLNTSVLREKYFKDTVVVVKEVDGVAQPQEMKPLTDKQISEISNLSGATVEYKYYNISEDEIDKSEVKAKGTYYVRAYFTPTSIEYTAPYIQAKFQIVDTRIALTLTWKDDQTEFTYNGKVQHPIPIFTDAEGETVNVEFEYTSGHDKIKANLAGDTYTLELELKDLAYELKGTGTLGGNTASVTFTISRATFEIPTQIKNFEYIGQEIDLNNLTETECKLYFKGFDLSFMRVQFGEGVVGDKGTDAGHYTARIELLDPESAEFVGGKNVVSMNWTIDKALISVDWSGHEFYVQDAIKVPTVQQFYGFYGSDGELVDYSADIDYSGDIAVTSDGDYQITVYVKPSAAWMKNYELDNSKTCSFVVLPRAGMEIITIEWDANTIFKFNGSAQKPSFRIKNVSGVDITEQINASEFRFSYNDGLSETRWKGDYTVTVSMRPGSNYYLKGDPTCLYSIDLNDAGEGNDPNTVQKPDDDGEGDKNRTDTLNLPLWQLIVGGASAVLFVFCTLKAFGEYGKLKAAKKEAKELAVQSYATTYGFAPLGLLAMASDSTFLGLEETPWTIIAFVALGLFLVSAVALFLLSKKRKAAELVVKREQARIAEEKEFAREEEMLRREEQHREEQARRDNEMKMMFAAMQQGGGYQQAPFQYDDMRSMLAETMQALLPAAMQQMQALPPAQSDPNAYAQPSYSAPVDSARSQKEDMLLERLARQEELINQLLQNQQAQQSAPAYEEEPVDDISWLGESDEVVSLEESYGALSDEGKRAYYEIGSYIMSKPRTSQNDGRYAVLFKYRGRTLFKLSIKDDAPVLYYPAGGGRAEVRVENASSLELAKSAIDRSVSSVDSQMA